DQFPEEYAKYYMPFAIEAEDPGLDVQRDLNNPMHYIGTEEVSDSAKYFRIRVGASDADTSFTVSMALALKLENAGKPVDYALVWDKPHCEADYPGEFCDWIESICAR
ncbi:MAG: alpha/beta hydrolase, partial [Clostridiales bacterium]|nr:alpha/beta hydrolase [Clostridiales bacterium]